MPENAIVIIGGGHGGSQMAASLREKGYAGPLTLVTAEGDVPYQRPPLSKAFLKDPVHDLLPLRPESFYDKNAIELRLGAEATRIDLREGKVILADGSAVAFDKLALATGSRPRLPPIEGIALDGVFTLRNVDDARKLRERLHRASDVVVVGGGFIGLEVAATARLLGKTVTVLEAAPRLMGRVVAPEISDHFLDLHRGWGTDIRLNTAVGRIVGEGGRVVAVETAGRRADRRRPRRRRHRRPPQSRTRQGRRPRCRQRHPRRRAHAHQLCPRSSRSAIASRFDHWSTGRSIRLESVQNAVDQARTAERDIAGPWRAVSRRSLVLVGSGRRQAADGRPVRAMLHRSVLRGRPESGSFSVFYFKNNDLVAIDSVNRAADHVVGRHMLGAGMSPSAAECADEGVDLKRLFKSHAAPAKQPVTGM